MPSHSAWRGSVTGGSSEGESRKDISPAIGPWGETGALQKPWVSRDQSKGLLLFVPGHRLVQFNWVLGH